MFDAARLQQVVDFREQLECERSMGFSAQFLTHRRFQYEFLVGYAGLSSSHHVLEIGCGPLTAGIPIIEYLHSSRYTGIDVRPSVLNIAWREVGKAQLSHKNPRLLYSSTFGIDELGGQKFDFIIAFSMIYHLSDDLLPSFFRSIQSHLAETGVCFGNVDLTDVRSKWLEFPFIGRVKDDYHAASAKNGLSMHALGSLQDLGFSEGPLESHNEMLSFRLTPEKSSCG